MNKITYDNPDIAFLDSQDKWLYEHLGRSEGYHTYGKDGDCTYHAFDADKWRYLFTGTPVENKFEAMLERLKSVGGDYDFDSVFEIIHDSSTGWERFIFKIESASDNNNYVFVLFDDASDAVLCKLEVE